MARLTVSLLGDAFSQAFRNLGAFASTQGIFILVGALVSLVMSFYVLDSADALVFAGERGDLGAMFAALLPVLAASVLGGVVGFLISMLALGAGVLVADALLRGETPSLGEVWQRLSPRLGNLVSTALIIILALMGVMVAGVLGFILIVPLFAAIVVAVYLLLRWAVALVVSVLENHSATGNLRRSGELTNGAKGMLFVLFLLLGLVFTVPGWIIGAAVTPSPDPDDFPEGTDPQVVLDAMRPEPTVLVLSWAVGTILQALGGFVTASLVTLVYHRLRTPDPVAAPPAPTTAGW